MNRIGIIKNKLLLHQFCSAEDGSW